ncbi:non-homologous end joining protein Ku [Egicoccus halophilus]|uniref:Non-homologous end joining protein Ku n=1 Tax=Egicoccus halophilus TaxID=1670830 RepID=A0A8J3EYU2_9ACTN|nr:Ku protein [Egicoccus halophilus]GGI08566.1 non-homologous end joining protein Ku [Egicoccus halophilus]
MARPTWSGSISFGLVSVPVQLFTAVRTHSVRFTQLHKDTGNRVRNKRVDETTGDEVAYGDIVKGYEVADGQYVVVDPDELDELDPEASRLIDIEDFVELQQIDPVYYDRAYYLMPSGDAAAKPYKLLAEAMEQAGKVAVARFVMRNKEYLAAVRARDGLLVLSTMHYADEVADPADLEATDTLEQVEVAPRELAMAEQLIDSLVTDFDPERYHDEYQQRVTSFLEAKAEGQELEVTPPERDTGGVIDLMAALEQSLESAKRDRGGEGTGSSRGRDYGAMTKDELYDLAQERDLPGRSSMSKEELVEALGTSDASSKAS